MITIISASNRVGNLTSLFANQCQRFFEEAGENARLFELDTLPDKFSMQSVYQYKTSVFAKYSKEYIRPVDKLLFIVPEYNGSMPGILKLFIDAVEPREFVGKKAALIGVSAGRAGNLRGMDHLTDILHYLQVEVMPFKLPISQLNQLIEKGNITHEPTLKLLREQTQKLIDY